MPCKYAYYDSLGRLITAGFLPHLDKQFLMLNDLPRLNCQQATLHRPNLRVPSYCPAELRKEKKQS
jgi:hypothetical protein